MTTKAVRENKYITNTVKNGTIVFTVGAVAYAVLAWAGLFLVRYLMQLIFAPSTYGFYSAHHALATTILVLAIAIPLAAASFGAARLLLLVFPRLKINLNQTAGRNFIILSIVLSVIFGIGFNFLSFSSYEQSWAVVTTYVGILILGLPFTLSLLWVTHRPTK